MLLLMATNKICHCIHSFSIPARLLCRNVRGMDLAIGTLKG